MTAPTPNTDPTTAPASATPPNTAPTNTTPKPSDPKAGDPPANPPANEDKPLGPAGEKALQAERDARKALEKELKTYEPLKKLIGALGDGEPANGKTDIEQLTERLTNHETELATERAARWRAEVAHEKGLTPQQAARLVGANKDELTADADALLSLFPAATPGTPKPNPHQGARGGAGVDLDARIAEAQKAGDWRKVMQLQNQKLAEQNK